MGSLVLDVFDSECVVLHVIYMQHHFHQLNVVTCPESQMLVVILMLLHTSMQNLVAMCGFRESLSQARMQDLDTLDDPSDIMETVPELLLFDAISSFLESIGMYECHLDVSCFVQCLESFLE